MAVKKAGTGSGLPLASATGVKKKILENLRGFAGGNHINAICASPENYHAAVLALAHYLSKLKLNGIYITVNLPYLSIKQSFSQKGVDTSRIFFIDAISRSSGEQATGGDCIFVSGPAALTELSIAFDELISRKKFSYVVFDSVSTLLAYEDILVVERFVHYLSTKARARGLNIYFVAVEDEDNSKLLSLLNQLCDSCVKT